MARRRCQHRGEGEAVVLAQFAAREVEIRNAGLDQKTGNQDGSRAAYLSPVPLCVRLSFVMFSGSGTVVVGGVDSSVLVVADRAMRVVLYHDDAAVRVVDAALPDEMLGSAAVRCREQASWWRRRGQKNKGLASLLLISSADRHLTARAWSPQAHRAPPQRPPRSAPRPSPAARAPG